MSEIQIENCWLGDVAAAQGRRPLALRHYHQSLALSRKVADQHGQAYTLNSIGYLQEALGQRRRAAQSYQAALQLARNVEEQSAEALTLYHLARNASARGQLQEACARLAESLKISEKLRVNVASRDLRTSYFASVHQRYELYTDLLMHQHWRNPAGGFDKAALEASEQARARSLPEVLSEAHADIRQGVEPALLAQADDLRQRLNAAAQRKLALLNAGNAQAEAAALTREIGDLNSELDQVQGRIRDSSPHYAALLQPAPPRLAEIQRTLDDTLLLEYALGEERSYLWLVSRDGLAVHQLPPRAEIERAAKPVYELLNGRQLPSGYSAAQRRARYQQKAQTLSRILLGPVAARLGERRLLIVADGILQYLPFGALPVPERRAAFVPLLLKHEISHLPSAATLGLLRQESARRQTTGPPTVAVLADPFFDLQDSRLHDLLRRLQGPAKERLLSRLRDGGAPQKSYSRLFSSGQEADAIKALLPPERCMIATGAAASRELVLCGALNHYRIVHLAAHGDFNSTHPELSALVLAQYDGEGVKKDGHLWLPDIYNLRLSADLVVLSACDTALGREVRGEGLLGLTRGFMYAGAARVLASLWRVDDDSTAALMKEFYRRHLLEQQPVSAALRQAQLALLNDPQHPQWQAPWHWAAFVLQGDWR